MEEDEQRPRFQLVIGGVRCEHTPENRRRFMTEVQAQPAAAASILTNRTFS